MKNEPIKVTYCWNCVFGSRMGNGHVRCYRDAIFISVERGDGFCSHAEPRGYIATLENIRKRMK